MSINYVTRFSRLFRQASCAALTCSTLLSQSWACTTDCAITVNFTGVYNDETCNVMINNASSSESMTLPKFSTAALQSNAAESGRVPFYITLTDCPASRTITAFFNSSVSSADSTTGNLVNSTGMNYSSNVQIRLRKEDGSQVVIDNNATGQDYVIPSTGTQVSHTFTAAYYANGDAAVTAGLVQAIAGVELVYK